MAPQAVLSNTQLPALPQIIEVKREEEKIVPEKVYLQVVDPTVSSSPMKHLMVQLENGDDNTEVLVDLLTNNDRFAFVNKVIRTHFNRFTTIYESWEVSDPF